MSLTAPLPSLWRRQPPAGGDRSLRSTIPTAFLTPDLKAAILDGCLPAGLTLEAITRREMPLDWEAQRRL